MCVFVLKLLLLWEIASHFIPSSAYGEHVQCPPDKKGYIVVRGFNKHVNADSTNLVPYNSLLIFFLYSTTNVMVLIMKGGEAVQRARKYLVATPDTMAKRGLSTKLGRAAGNQRVEKEETMGTGWATG